MRILPGSETRLLAEENQRQIRTVLSDLDFNRRYLAALESRIVAVENQQSRTKTNRPDKPDSVSAIQDAVTALNDALRTAAREGIELSFITTSEKVEGCFLPVTIFCPQITKRMI